MCRSAERLARQMVEHERRVGQIVEQRVEPLVEERQPVLHAGKAPAFADRRIERIVARRRAERLDVAAAEAADRLWRQRHLAHRLQRRASCAGRWCAASPDRRRGSSPACRRRSRAAAPRRIPARRGRGCRRARRTRRPRAPSARARSRSSPAAPISTFMSIWLPGRAKRSAPR